MLTFIDVDIRHRMASLLMLYSTYDLDLHFKVKINDMLIFRKWYALAQKSVISVIDFDICNRTAPLRMSCCIISTFVFKAERFLVMPLQ